MFDVKGSGFQREISLFLRVLLGLKKYKAFFFFFLFFFFFNLQNTKTAYITYNTDLLHH